MTIFNHFPHVQLSSDQKAALEKLELFLKSSDGVFILKGYAGSGKTTILKGLAEYLKAIERDYALMAPTGRAAKVIREKTGKEAFTIHKTIYSYEDMVVAEDQDSFCYYYKIKNNVDVFNKIFIVDEASMLSDAKSEAEFFRFGTGHLLSDLITYTRANESTVNSKVIFVGDPYQLPPVTDNSAKAFDTLYLTNKFKVSVVEAELREVKRHDEESGILKAAKKIRTSATSGFFNDFNLRENGKDIFNPPFEDFLNIWQQTPSPKIIIAAKNTTCLNLNLQIREKKYRKANLPIQKGDIVILGGNNYKKGIFNGEFAVVNEVTSINTTRTIALKGKPPVILSWRNIELIFPDAESSNKIVSGKMLENFLHGDNYLKPEEMQALYVDFINRHKNLKPKTEAFKEAIINDEFFNCLLMKFGYAVTCHKAQGGEWDNVFTIWDHDNRENFNCFNDPQIRAGKTNENFYRWAYTAITRASKALFAVNPPYFNSYSSVTFLDSEVINSLNELGVKQYNSEEIILDNELLAQLKKFDLLEQPIQIQNYFIKTLNATQKHFIEISGWEKKNLEIFYYFKREDKTAAFKTWINRELVFNNKYQCISSSTNSIELYKEVEDLLKKQSNVSVKRNTSETIINKIEFDLELEERFPFIKNLYDDIESLLKETAIIIDYIDHQHYRERYTLKGYGGICVVDFEYNKNGFFGRVIPVLNKSNSQSLLQSAYQVLQTLKQQEHAS